MDNLTTTYALERLEEVGPGLLEALKIYTRHIPPSTRTSTSEITYWCTRYKEALHDDLFLFALRRNSKIIGFAELVFFSAEKLLVIDYLVIDEAHRRLNAFFEFISLIHNYLDNLNVQFTFVVTEVGNFSLRNHTPDDSRKLIRLLKMAGFGVVKSLYFQPSLDLANPETEMRATLMLMRNDPIDRLKRETYLGIVRTIFYKHYLRWYQPFPGIDLAEYRRRIDKLFSEIESGISGKEVKINGSWEVPIEASCSQPHSVTSVRLSGALVALVLCVFLVLCTSKYCFELGSKSVVVLVLLSLLVVLGILALFFKRALLVFDRTLAKLIGLFSGKRQ